MQPAEARRRINQWMRSSGGDEAALKDPASRLQVDMLAQFLCTAAGVMEDEQVNPVQAERVLQGILYANTLQYARWREHEREQKAMMDLLAAQGTSVAMVVPAKPDGSWTFVLERVIPGDRRTVSHLLNTRLLKVTAEERFSGVPVSIDWRVVGPQQVAVSLKEGATGTYDLAVRIEPA